MKENANIRFLSEKLYKKLLIGGEKKQVQRIELLRAFSTLTPRPHRLPHTALLRRLCGVIGISCRWHAAPKTHYKRNSPVNVYPLHPALASPRFRLAEKGNPKPARALGKERSRHCLARENTPNGTSNKPLRWLSQPFFPPKFHLYDLTIQKSIVKLRYAFCWQPE